jgi:hypothetical protein
MCSCARWIPNQGLRRRPMCVCAPGWVRIRYQLVARCAKRLSAASSPVRLIDGRRTPGRRREAGVPFQNVLHLTRWRGAADVSRRPPSEAGTLARRRATGPESFDGRLRPAIDPITRQQRWSCQPARRQGITAPSLSAEQGNVDFLVGPAAPRRTSLGRTWPVSRHRSASRTTIGPRRLEPGQDHRGPEHTHILSCPAAVC